MDITNDLFTYISLEESGKIIDIEKYSYSHYKKDISNFLLQPVSTQERFNLSDSSFYWIFKHGSKEKQNKVISGIFTDLSSKYIEKKERMEINMTALQEQIIEPLELTTYEHLLDSLEYPVEIDEFTEMYKSILTAILLPEYSQTSIDYQLISFQERAEHFDKILMRIHALRDFINQFILSTHTKEYELVSRIYFEFLDVILIFKALFSGDSISTDIQKGFNMIGEQLLQKKIYKREYVLLATKLLEMDEILSNTRKRLLEKIDSILLQEKEIIDRHNKNLKF